MWSYYGSKSKIINSYPPPKFDRIIEPFAGTARYALKFYDRDVLLVDKWDVIIKIWEYLQSASKSDIMGLPEPKYKESIEHLHISEPERLLLGFLVARGVAKPQFTVQQFSDIRTAKKQISNQLFKIKHWIIKQASYTDIENQEATWFIDPPYQIGGKFYKEHELDYDSLGRWCKERFGQSIVCENTKATWLPFLPMRKLTGAYTITTEAIWSNYPTEYDYLQMVF